VVTGFNAVVPSGVTLGNNLSNSALLGDDDDDDDDDCSVELVSMESAIDGDRNDSD